jgi:hypothetical protein
VVTQKTGADTFRLGARERMCSTANTIKDFNALNKWRTLSDLQKRSKRTKFRLLCIHHDRFRKNRTRWIQHRKNVDHVHPEAEMQTLSSISTEYKKWLRRKKDSQPSQPSQQNNLVKLRVSQQASREINAISLCLHSSCYQAPSKAMLWARIDANVISGLGHFVHTDAGHC